MSAELLGEIEDILSRENLDTGRLWRVRHEFLSNAELMDRLHVNSGQLGTLKLQIRVLREGFIPSSPSTAEKGAHKVRGWLQRESMSDALRRRLVAQNAALSAVMAGTPGPVAPDRPKELFDWSTVEWVKDPVDLKTTLPTGAPITMRHLRDCPHWFRTPEGDWIGAAPRLATDVQMRDLPACKDCASRAGQSSHEEQGPRLDAPDPARSYWWVSQGYNYEIAIEQQTLWSLPKKGRDLPDRRLLLEMRPGDVVLHYADGFLRAVSTVKTPWRDATRPEGYRMREGDGDEGWLVHVDVQQTGLSIPFQKIAELIPHGPPGPLTKSGVPMQIYVARLNEEFASRLLDAAGAFIPDSPVGAGLPVIFNDLDGTDAEALTRVRREQRYLRRHLLGGKPEAACALCGRVFPAKLLVAAHIVPRRHLDEAERLNFTAAAMLACALGCDALFESGYVSVDESGRVCSRREASNDALREAVARLVGRPVVGICDESAVRFAEHRRLHG